MARAIYPTSILTIRMGPGGSGSWKSRQAGAGHRTYCYDSQRRCSMTFWLFRLYPNA